MSYRKAMKFQKAHPKGTKQPMLMHTNSGFWPSSVFTLKWVKYAEQQEANGLPYDDCETYYKKQLR